MADQPDTETILQDQHIPVLDEVVAATTETPPTAAAADSQLQAPKMDVEATREALQARLEGELRDMVEAAVCAAAERAAAGLEQMLRHEVCRSLRPRIAQLVDEALTEALPPEHQDRLNGSANERE